MMKFKKPKKCSEKKSQDKSENLCKKIWSILKGDENNGIDSDNFKVFIAAIMKLKIGSEQINSEAQYGEFNAEGQFEVNKQQRSRIHKDCSVFCINRTAYNSPVIQPLGEPECTFKPSLCDLSLSMASTTRGRSMNSFTNHNEQLTSTKEKRER